MKLNSLSTKIAALLSVLIFVIFSYLTYMHFNFDIYQKDKTESTSERLQVDIAHNGEKTSRLFISPKPTNKVDSNLILFFSAAFLLFVFWLVWRLLLQLIAVPLSETAEAASAIASGSMQGEIKFKGTQEIEAIGTALNKIQHSVQKRQKEVQQQNWITSNLTEFSELLQQETRGMGFLERAIGFVARTTEAGYVGIYIRKSSNSENVEQTSGDELVLSASYGDKPIVPVNSDATVSGLVKQCSVDKQPIHLTNLSDRDHNIVIGLSKIRSKNILIKPIIYNDTELLGVLELASYNSLSDIHLLYIKQMLLLLASAIKSNQVDRTEELLKQTQQQTLLITKQEERLRSIFDSALGSMITIDEKGSIDTFNVAAEKLFGYSKEEVIGKNVKMLMPDSFANEHDRYLAEYSKTGNKKVIGIGRDVIALRKDGTEVPVHLSIGELMLDGKKFYIGTLQDISAQQKAQLLINHQEKRLRSIFDSALGSMITIDSKGIIDDFNRAAEKLFGYTLDEVVGKNVKMLMPESFATEHDRYLGTYAETGNKNVIGVGREVVAMRKDGSTVPVHLSVGEMKIEGKTFYIGTLQDISEQKRNQALITRQNIKLQEEKEKVEQAMVAKDNFLATMSHEIRTPINGVLGMLSLLQHSDMTADQISKLEIAKASANNLLTVINDILDFSKIEAGKMDLESIDFNIRGLLGDFIKQMSFRAEEKGLELVLDLSECHAHNVRGDPGRVRQILTNLVGNAIKFTEEGEVIVRVASALKDSKFTKLSCSVFDTGIGISGDKLDSLFESFTQADSSTTRKYGGSGLGLSICKQLCALMRGEIKVQSEVNKGSCFSFELLLDKSDTPNFSIPQIHLTDVPILIVDDNLTNRQVLKGQLENMGAIVSEAENAKLAIKSMRNRLENNRSPIFKVAILDMQMPEMSGDNLGRAIRADHRFDKTRLIMMTSMSSRGDAKYFADIGFDAYFSKPATESDLFDSLSLVVSGGDALNKATPLITSHYISSLRVNESPPKQNSSAKVLLVEDNTINQAVAQGILESVGYTSVKIAENGIEAISALKQSSQSAEYSVVLMDCQMPKLDGYETTKEIRNGACGDRYKNIPIVAMTANAMKGDEDKCLKAGMNDYVTKPIDAKILQKKLLHWT